MKNSVVIIDYGMGNIGSVANIIRRVGGDSIVSSDPDVIRSANKLILPGVGSFDNGVSSLSRLGLIEAIQDAVGRNGTLLLGICLGMQLMLQSSEEGTLPGLGLISGRVRRFNFESRGKDSLLKIPHMGWNHVEATRQSRIFSSDDRLQRFYFVHSYYVECDDKKDIVGISNHGGDFTSAFERDNLIGVQFHPEKSHKFGVKLFSQFLGES